MVLVDCVLSFEPGVSITSIKAITGSEPCYSGLPVGLELGSYAYPTSLLLESFGQTAAIRWLKSVRPPNVDRNNLFMFAVARNCRIEGRAFPGDVVRHVARLDHVVGDNVFVSGETCIGHRRIATMGSMIATVRARCIVIERATTQDSARIKLPIRDSRSCQL